MTPRAPRALALGGALVLVACGEGRAPSDSTSGPQASGDRPRPVVGVAVDGSGASPRAIDETLRSLAESEGIELTLDDWKVVRRMASRPPVAEDPTNRLAGIDEAIALGHALFFERSFSGNGEVACATCHDPDRAFTDGRPVGVALGTGTRNTISILNAGHRRWLTWDGRADSLWAQALEPIEADHEMGGDRWSIARRVVADDVLRAPVERVLDALAARDPASAAAERSAIAHLASLDPDSVPRHARPRRDGASDEWSRAWDALDEADRDAATRLFVLLGKALGAYQERLTSGDSPFDRFVARVESGAPDLLRNDGDGAFDARAARGLALFLGKGNCIECHAGVDVTGDEFHLIGVPARAGGMPTDAGRWSGAAVMQRDEFNAAGAWSDAPDGPDARLARTLVNPPDNWGRFRTPALREVARTAPYMHEGVFESLEEVVRFYSTLEGAVQLDHHQESVLVPLELTDDEIDALVAFLESLTGRLDQPALGAPPTRNQGG